LPPHDARRRLRAISCPENDLSEIDLEVPGKVRLLSNFHSDANSANTTNASPAGLDNDSMSKRNLADANDKDAAN